MAHGETIPSAVGRLGEPGLLIDDRYRLEQLLGAGGFGEVWRATQEVEGSQVRPVALKLLVAPGEGGTLPVAATPAAGSVAGSDVASLGGHRWLDEVRAVRDVKCDAIATIFDVGIARQPRVAYIAMELLEGRTLEYRLREGKLYWRRALAITRSIAEALTACHKVGVSHCDLKPANVYLHGDGRVYVLDFGVAALGNETDWRRKAAPLAVEAVLHEVDPNEMGATGAVDLDEVPGAAPAELGVRLFGTPGYIAPESFQGQAPGPASDLYALGTVLYQMIAGRMPQALPQGVEIPSRTTTAASAQRYQTALNAATVRGETVPIRDVVCDLPDAVCEFVEQLLDPDPTRRGGGGLLEALEEVWNRPWGVPEPPYVGLAAFGPRRAGYIAGRDGDIDDVSVKLKDHRAIVLCGPSGCGKSSLATAGVAPRIDQQLLLDADGWRMVSIRPSEGTESLRLAAGSDKQAADTQHLGTVVVVDQLEEVLTLAPDDREAYCEALASLADGSAAVVVSGALLKPSDRIRVIATVRDDLFGKVASLPELRRFPERNLYTVRGVEPNAMSAIVAGPAAAAKYELEDQSAVIAEAVRIVQDDPGALPLVQFALTRWWEARDSQQRRLTKVEWERIGGIEGALAEAAQTLHDSFADGEREAMKDILVALFRPDGTRIRVKETSLARSASSRSVLARLLERRLLTRQTGTDQGETVEVVHEALGIRWPRLHGWLEETHAERELLHDISYDVERWNRAGRPRDLLWRGARLQAAADLRDKLEPLAREFVAAASTLDTKQRWRRRGVFTVMAGLLAVAVVLVMSYLASNRERRRAEVARSQAETAKLEAMEASAHAKREAAANIELKRQADAERNNALTEKNKALVAQKAAEDAEAKAKEEAQANIALREQAQRAKDEALKARAAAEKARLEVEKKNEDAVRQREIAREEAKRADRESKEAEALRKFAEIQQQLAERSLRKTERVEAEVARLDDQRKALTRELEQCRKGR